MSPAAGAQARGPTAWRGRGGARAAKAAHRRARGDQCEVWGELNCHTVSLVHAGLAINYIGLSRHCCGTSIAPVEPGLAFRRTTHRPHRSEHGGGLLPLKQNRDAKAYFFCLDQLAAASAKRAL